MTIQDQAAFSLSNHKSSLTTLKPKYSQLPSTIITSAKTQIEHSNGPKTHKRRKMGALKINIKQSRRDKYLRHIQEQQNTTADGNSEKYVRITCN